MPNGGSHRRYDHSVGRYVRFCARCDRWLPETEDVFSFLHQRGRYHSVCKECARAYRRERSAQGINRRTQRAEDHGARRFGVEIEFLGDPYAVEREMRNQGLVCNREQYNHHVRSYWKIVPDGSVGGGAELVSPILRGESGRNAILAAGRALKAAGCTVDTRTGLHVHHEVRDLSLVAFKNLIHSWAASQDAIDTFVSRSRRNQVGNYGPGGRSNFTQRLTSYDLADIDALSSLRTNQRVLNNRDGRRYRTLNFACYGRYGTVEIRQHQGTIEGDKIVAWIDFGQAFIEAAKAARFSVLAGDSLLAVLRENGGLAQTTSDYMTRRAARLARAA